MIRTLLAASAAVIVGWTAQPASAAFINVSTVFSQQVVGTLPAGLAIACSGSVPGAVTSIPGGCEGGVSTGNLTLTPGSFTVPAVNPPLTGTLTLANVGTTPFTGTVEFTVGFSAFNPGGPAVGIGINNANESAVFSSFVNGPGSIHDAHACLLPAQTLGDNGFGGHNFSTLTCGVLAPDESFLPLVFSGTLNVGQATFFGYSTLIGYSFNIPEPATFALLGGSLFGLGLVRRRR